MSRNPDIKNVIIVSDGCCAQFKSKLPFYYLSHASPTNINIERVYLGSGHGKNDCDWSGGAVKRLLTRDVKRKKAELTDIKSVYNHCKEFFTVDDDTRKEISSF